MITSRTKPCFISLHRLCQLSGRNRVTVLLRVLDREIEPDALLDVGKRTQPLFTLERVDELKRMPMRKSPTPLNPML